MAHREHVRRTCGASALAAAIVLTSGCPNAGSQATEFRGRVIDQDSGQPIAGAIVVGQYTGSRGLEAASSCNRVESAVSDQDGWFTLPLDPEAGPLTMEAYHRNYKWGKNPRKAWPGADGNITHWQVTVYQWDAENKTSTIVRTEPTIYRSETEAIEASREKKDVYLKSFGGSREQRLDELHRLSNAGSCGGTHRTTPGPVPFFEAIYAEEVDLGDSPRNLEMTRDDIRSAQSKFARAASAK